MLCQLYVSNMDQQPTNTYFSVIKLTLDPKVHSSIPVRLFFFSIIFFFRELLKKIVVPFYRGFLEHKLVFANVFCLSSFLCKVSSGLSTTIMNCPIRN